MADEHFYYFTHHDQFYRVRRDKWDEIYAASRQQTDAEHDEVTALGGLHIVATERHESRRIDNQLRGRAGRQGDPGSSRFFLSLQDDLLRIFGGERMQNLMLRLGMEEDVPIEIASSSPSASPRRRKPSKCRISRRANTSWNTTTSTTSSARRFTACAASCWKAWTRRSASWTWCGASSSSSSTCAAPSDKHPDTWDLDTLRNDILTPVRRQDRPERDLANLTRVETGRPDRRDGCKQKYQEKEDLVGADMMRQTERIVMLQVIDNQWKDHLLSMDELKQGIGNRAYGQKDPLVEYKKESYELFTAMMDRIEDETVRYLFFLQVHSGSGPVLPFPEEDEEDEAATERSRSCRTKRPRARSRGRATSAWPPRAPWRTSRAISSARRKRNWRSCNSWAATDPSAPEAR